MCVHKKQLHLQEITEKIARAIFIAYKELEKKDNNGKVTPLSARDRFQIFLLFIALSHKNTLPTKDYCDNCRITMFLTHERHKTYKFRFSFFLLHESKTETLLHVV